MVLVTPGNQLRQWKALRPTETAVQVLFSPAVIVYKLEPALTSSLLPLPSPREGGGQGATTLRKSLCCRAQPLNSVTFREPHIYFKDLLFALESSSQIPSLHPLNSNTHCWELRVSCREGWTWTLRQVAWILGVMVTEARMKHVPSTASSVSDVQWITVASRVQVAVLGRRRRLCEKDNSILFVVQFTSSSFPVALELARLLLGHSEF